MKIKATKVQSAFSAFKGEVIGTFKSILEKGEKLRFSTKNLLTEWKKDKDGENLYNRVTVFVYKEDEPDEAPEMIACSENLSKTIRKALANGKTRKQTFSVLVGLPVIKDDKGRHFISIDGTQEEAFDPFAKVKEEEKVTFAELAGF